MGFSYLNGKYWAEVTREERFFCQHLFGLLVCDEENRILSCIKDHDDRREPPRADEWEPAFEACFYRDIWHLREREGELYSPKRTFDLCLFSEESILIIEAKAQQAFDVKQLESFKTDRDQVRKATGVQDVRVYGLASSQYEPSDAVLDAFDGPLLTWHSLSELYGGDKVLARADELYDPKELDTWGKNNDRYMCGEELIAAHRRGEVLCVGRDGGLRGSEFRNDLLSGDWRTRQYETSFKQAPPNRNWFLLSDFAAAVKEA